MESIKKMLEKKLGKEPDIQHRLLNTILFAAFMGEMIFLAAILIFGIDGVVRDCTWSVVIVTCIFGVVFKYQSYIYEKQHLHLMEQERELRYTLEKLRVANNVKTNFLSNMSHEIRTPINAMMGMSEVIARESHEASIRNYADKIDNAGRTLISLVDNILAEKPLAEDLDNGSIKVVQEKGKHGLDFTAPKAKVLAVDDIQMNLEVIKSLLKETAIQLDTALSGKECLKLISENEYHIIFMDHMMPGMDGIETFNRIKNEKESKNKNTPVVVLTANAIAGAREEYLKAGFFDYLAKPICIEELEKVLLRYLPEKLVQPKEEEIKQESTGEGKSFLEQLDFLDTESGLAYCCNSEEFYREMLISYRQSGKYEELQNYYDIEDIENYRIVVHALKSTSLSIGAADISEKAKSLELAAKENDWEYIDEHHSELMEHYGKLLEQLDNVISNKNNSDLGVDETEKRETILVVDDDSMNLKMAENMLKDEFAVSFAASGREAFAFLEEVIPDLILLDQHMPEMDGFEVINRLKQDERYADIPVIFLTADNDRDTEVQGFKKGAVDFITKPFIATTALWRIKRTLELDELKKNLQQEVEKQTRKAEERRLKVERLSMQVMKTLAGTIDAKDKYTNGHSLRVAEYSREIARRSGKTEKEQEDIYYMGLLHDIGKIGIPDEIISKKSGLTQEEEQIIRMHPIIGADILKNISEIPQIEIGAHWHHERYDGNGYPDGKKGTEIPEVARIIGVADAYDAMTSKRSYRDVLPQKVARDEIQKGRGIQFDPYFSDKMLEMIDEDTEYKLREM